jgi:hypothetical protein
MIGTTTQVFDIRTIHTVQPSNGALAIAFQSGPVVWLSPHHPEHDRILREAEWSLREQRPVGVLVNGDGCLLELSPAHDTCVRSIRTEEEDQSRLPVWFWQYSPVCYLTRDHPDFDRIRATLEQAAATGAWVWLANRMHMVEDETEIWWKILDVRPIPGPPPRA